MAETTLAAANPQKRKTASTIDNVTSLLSKNFGAIRSCLPKHLTAERMCRIAVQFMQSEKNSNILQCSAISLVNCVIEAASLGLEIDSRGLAYIVPFWEKASSTKKATLIFGYKGLMELAYRSGRVSNIYAETVCENDEFVFELGLQPRLEHKPNLDDRGCLRAVYAVARMKDADPVFVVLGRQDVEKIKKASKSADSGPWQTWEEEMWKKTAIRRLCKYLPLSPEMSRAIAVDEAVEAGVNPQYLAEGLINLPEEEYIEVEANPKEKIEKAEIPKKDTDKSAKAENGEKSKASQPPKLEPGDILCPKETASGKPNLVEEVDCKACKDRAGCPVYD